MIFELLPTIDIMLALYKQPRNMERFREYLKTLQGETKGDLAMPISGFNPMAKEHVIVKLAELKELQAEKIIAETLAGLNKKLTRQVNKNIFKVALNLSDDLAGGWTNRFTSDYDSKFKINALVNRQFCTPFFWTSETFTTAIIKERTLEYAFRTIYRATNPTPETLGEHIEQEKFVAKNNNKEPVRKIDIVALDLFFKQYRHSESYHIIFNFFYGDNASTFMQFPTFGVKEDMAGFEYAKQLCQTGT